MDTIPLLTLLRACGSIEGRSSVALVANLGAASAAIGGECGAEDENGAGSLVQAARDRDAAPRPTEEQPDESKSDAAVTAGEAAMMLSGQLYW